MPVRVRSWPDKTAWGNEILRPQDAQGGVVQSGQGLEADRFRASSRPGSAGSACAAARYAGRSAIRPRSGPAFFRARTAGSRARWIRRRRTRPRPQASTDGPWSSVAPSSSRGVGRLVTSSTMPARASMRCGSMVPGTSTWVQSCSGRSIQDRAASSVGRTSMGVPRRRAAAAASRCSAGSAVTRSRRVVKISWPGRASPQLPVATKLRHATLRSRVSLNVETSDTAGNAAFPGGTHDVF